MVLGGRHPSTFGTMYRRKNIHEMSEENILAGPLRALELAFKEAEGRKAEAYRRGMLPDHATIIEHGPIRILLSGSPDPDTLPSYANKLAKYNVRHVVRVCEPTYDGEELRALGFRLHNWTFPDGEAPPEHVLVKWLALLDHIFKWRTSAKSSSGSSALSDMSSDSDASLSPKTSSDVPKETVAIHCAAGLGRAPVLAAIALVELGVDPFDAVGWIRALRRGAINASQMAFVETYSRRPPPPPARRRGSRSRSGSFVGSFWPSLKAARPFRPRSPAQNASTRSSPSSPRRMSNSSASRFSE